MDKANTTRHWKEVHHSRRDSVGSLSQSFQSNRSRSSLSSGYNRFNFHKNEENVKRSSIFQFKPRNKNNPYDVSLLIKKEGSRTPKPQKIPTQESLPNLEKMLRKMPTFGVQKQPSQLLKSLARDLKSTIQTFRSTIQYFQKQFKELRWDWQRTLKNLMAKEVGLESHAVLQLKRKLDEKQREIEKIVKQSSAWDKNGYFPGTSGASDVKVESSLVQSPLKHLGISKVDTKVQQNVLSRNNTLQSLLNMQHHRPHSIEQTSQKPQKQVMYLQQRLRKMRQVLDCQA